MNSGDPPKPLNYAGPTAKRADEVAKSRESTVDLLIVPAAVAVVILVQLAVALYFNRW